MTAGKVVHSERSPASDRDRLEQTKRDWWEGKFPQVPRETEFIFLPEAQTVVSYP